MKRIVLPNIFCTFALIAILSSCTKEIEKPELNDGVSTVVSDLAGDLKASIGDPEPGSGKEKRQFHTFTFSFKTGRQQFVVTGTDSAQYLKNTEWDIAFTNEYNSLVVVNNGSLSVSPGYGGPGKGKMLIINKPYNEIREAPSETEFETNGIPGAGWDNGNGSGWYFYSLQNHICVPVKNRTFILKTAAGKYAKLELLNIYKGNPPVVTDLFWPAPYLTFRYFVQEDGSRNLITKN
jgi:hypothetical protein